MQIQGVIFDFNGTLFWDTEFHNQAWDIYLNRLGMFISDTEKDEHFHGKPNKDIFEYLFQRSLTTDELTVAIEEKESIYRDICVKTNPGLAPGALGFLEFLKNNKVPFNIATSSGYNNVNFFFKQFLLDKWFDKGKVVYDDGSFNGKPAPDIFILAAQRIGIPVSESVIFEDSVTGLKAAANAKAQKVFYVKSNNIEVTEKVDQVITDFNQVDRRMFG
jgi:beta-phosphoglucomutase-like phosphatase (HAD superfamily)